MDPTEFGITMPFRYTGTGVRLIGETLTSRSDGSVFTIFSELKDPTAQTIEALRKLNMPAGVDIRIKA